MLDRLHTLVLTGPHCCERILQGWQLIPILLLALAFIILAVVYLAQQIDNRKSAEWHAKLPPIPTAFTGREKEIQLILDFVHKERIRIVSITGGPAYGKSSLSIVCAHRLMALRMQVYYMPLSEANTIETFIMAFMHSVAVKSTEEVPQKKQLLHWVSSLRTRTVLVLDNVDHLTLNEKVRNGFLVLLKDIIAENENVQLVVTTRYRFNIADDFEEIHVHPLDTPQAINLLKDLILAARSADQDENMDFEVIVNKTGGIPLAIKVVGRLLKSKALSGAEIVQELSVNPLHTLSRESFTPDEQLRRCFDLSFKYLKPHEQQCFHYASRFPGSFDHKARDAIITPTTGEAKCLEHLVDRSLVEYSYLAKRYTMHSLLRAFAKGCVSTKYRKRKFYGLFAKHYMDLLSNCIIDARIGGNVRVVYTTTAEDYHNILHVLQLYVNGTIDHSVRDSDVLGFALATFEIMQPRFPQDALVDWWTKILKNTCNRARHDLRSFLLLMPPFVELSTKFGTLLLHYNKILHAKNILQFAEQCVKSGIMQFRPNQCHSFYTDILQVLKRVYERDGEIHRVLVLRTQIYSCIKSWRDPESTIPEDACSDGVAHLNQQITRNSGDIESALLLFDVLYKCNMLLEAKTVLQKLENTFHKDRLPMKAIVAVAKRFHLVKDYKKEVEWLTEATQFAEELTLFYIHFRLTRLYWHELDSQDDAIEHGKTAYDLAMYLKDQVAYNYNGHDVVFKAAVRLADILHQIDGRHTDAGLYFQEALDRLPFIAADAKVIFVYQEFIVSHLMSIFHQSNQYSSLVKHSRQWAELEMSRTILNIQSLLNLPYHLPRSSDTRLTETDDSLSHINDIGGAARQFMYVYVKQLYDSLIFYIKCFVIIIAIIIIFAVFLVVACSLYIPMYSASVILTLLFALLRYFVLLPLYCIRYFLFHAFTKHKLWIAHHISVIPKPITFTFWVNFIHVIVWVLCALGLYFWLMHSHYVKAPDTQYHNMTMMNIRDDHIYIQYL